MSDYPIGELSRRTGVKVPTVRFYEQRGLLQEPSRTAGNQRRYGNDALRRLGFIARARELGFTMEAIEELLTLSDVPDRPHVSVRNLALAQLADVRERLASLRRLEHELTHLADLCDGRGSGPCRILDAIANGDTRTDE